MVVEALWVLEATAELLGRWQTGLLAHGEKRELGSGVSQEPLPRKSTSCRIISTRHAWITASFARRALGTHSSQCSIPSPTGDLLGAPGLRLPHLLPSGTGVACGQAAPWDRTHPLSLKLSAKGKWNYLYTFNWPQFLAAEL